MNSRPRCLRHVDATCLPCRVKAGTVYEECLDNDRSFEFWLRYLRGAQFAIPFFPKKKKKKKKKRKKNRYYAFKNWRQRDKTRKYCDQYLEETEKLLENSWQTNISRDISDEFCLRFGASLFPQTSPSRIFHNEKTKREGKQATIFIYIYLI